MEITIDTVNDYISEWRNLGRVPYEMKQPENGFFVNYGDLKTLEKNILKILEDPKLAKQISKNNFKKSKNYAWDIIHNKYIEEYRKLLK